MTYTSFINSAHTGRMVIQQSYAKKLEGRPLDWAMALLGLVFVGGLFLDGWAHNNGKVDDSFFTPWHAVLYSGFGINFLVLAGVALLNRSRGYGWREALPAGYWLSLLGLGLWFIGGPGDLVWHTLFGIENDIEALYSPTHLLLASGMFLAASGPFRVIWARRGSLLGWWDQFPLMISMLITFPVVTFFVQYAHPVPNPWGLGQRFQPDIYQATGVLSWIVYSALLMGVVLMAMCRWRLVPGTFTLVIGLNALGMAFQESEYQAGLVVVFVVMGALVDTLYFWLKPGRERLLAVRLFAFAVPVLLSGAVFILGSQTVGIGWSIHLAAGAVFLTGMVGLLLSLLAFPPALPESEA